MTFAIMTVLMLTMLSAGFAGMSFDWISSSTASISLATRSSRISNTSARARSSISDAHLLRRHDPPANVRAATHDNDQGMTWCGGYVCGADIHDITRLPWVAGGFAKLRIASAMTLPVR